MNSEFLSYISQVLSHLTASEYFLIFSAYIFLRGLHSMVQVYFEDIQEYVAQYTAKPLGHLEVIQLPAYKSKIQDVSPQSVKATFVDEPSEPLASVTQKAPENIEDSIFNIKYDNHPIDVDSESPPLFITINGTQFYFEERASKDESLSDFNDLDQTAAQFLDKESSIILMNFDSQSKESHSLSEFFRGRATEDEFICKGVYPGIDLISNSIDFFYESPTIENIRLFNAFASNYKHVVLFYRANELGFVKAFIQNYNVRSENITHEAQSGIESLL